MNLLIVDGTEYDDTGKFKTLIDLERPMPGEIDLAEINRQMDEVVDPAADLWDAIQRRELRRIAQLPLRQRLRAEFQDEPERELIPYDYETGQLKSGPL